VGKNVADPKRSRRASEADLAIQTSIIQWKKA
jgi:hypothetical protein